MGNPHTLALLLTATLDLSEQITSIWTGAAFYVPPGSPGERNEDLVGNLPVALKAKLTHMVQTEVKTSGVKNHKRLRSSSDPSVLKPADRIISDALSGPAWELLSSLQEVKYLLPLSTIKGRIFFVLSSFLAPVKRVLLLFAGFPGSRFPMRTLGVYWILNSRKH